MSVAIPSLRGAIAVPEWAKNELWRKAQAAPSLDLRFADFKSLADAVTGTNLIDFTRASSGTYVGSDGLIKTATTNEPRFNHDPTTGESLGLLVEESRTNLLLRSEEFETTWVRTNITAFSLGSVANAEIAPNGTLTADLVAVTDGADSGTGFVSQDITKAAATTTYTATVFAKAQDWNAITLQVNDAATNNNRALATISLTTGAVAISAAAVGTFSAASATAATSFGNGWFRINLTFTSSTETGLRMRIYPNNSTTATSNGSNGIYIWGAQLEAGSLPTSYIPTEGSQVTRAADVPSISGANFSSWYRQDEGTVFVDFSVEGVYGASGYNRSFVFSDSTSADAFTLLQLGANAKFYESWLINGSQNMNFNTFDISHGKTIRYSSAYKQNDFQRYAFDVNNTLDSNTDTSIDVSSFTADSLFIGVEKTGFSQLNGTIRRLTYWPTRLSNETLQGITQ